MAQPTTLRLVTEATNATTSAADRARANHTGTQSADTITDGTTNKVLTAAERTKLAGIAAGATVNRADTATDAAIAAATAALVNSAPGTLDTLGELAAALTADEGTAATLATLVGTKAPLASPAFTGTPTINGTAVAKVSDVPAGYSDEQAQDAAAALFTAGTMSGITFTYDDAGNRINATVTPGTVADATTTSKGAVQLAGDLAGTAAAPTVPGLSAILQKSLSLPVNVIVPAGASVRTAVIGARNSVDASTGPLTVSLPTPTLVGQVLIIERADTSTNTANLITITGTVRGAASTITLAAVGAAFEGALYIAESLTSWAIASSIKPRAVLDAAYASRFGGTVNTITTNATAVIGVRNTVNATAAPVTVSLPTPTVVGQQLVIERVDTSTTNAITITGTIRGVANATAVLPAVGVANEGALWVAESLTSWIPAGSIKPKAFLDALYAPKPTGTPAAGKYVDGGTGAWTTLPAGGGSSATAASPAMALPGIGEYAVQGGVSVGASTYGNGEARLGPFWLPAGTYDAACLSINSAGSAGALLKIVGYWDSTTNPGRPGTLAVETAAVAATATGLVTYTGLSLVVPAGGAMLWCASVVQGAPSTNPGVIAVSRSADERTFPASYIGLLTVNVSTSWIATGITGAAPATPTVTAGDQHTRLAFRRSA